MEIKFLSNLIISKFRSTSTTYTQKNTKGKMHCRHCWAIIIKHEGETKYVSNNKSYISNINNMVILPKGCSYEWLCTQSGRFSFIEFDCDITYENILQFHINNGDKYVSDFKQIGYKSTLGDPLSKIECIRNTYSIIIELFESNKQESIADYRRLKILPAIEYIAKNFTKEIRNDTLAKECEQSTAHFRKLFRETYGISPIAYIHGIRIKKAKEMLKSDHGNISDIAYSLGYLNVYDFSRDFKKHTGVSPTKYIKQLSTN